MCTYKDLERYTLDRQMRDRVQLSLIWIFTGTYSHIATVILFKEGEKENLYEQEDIIKAQEKLRK